MKISARAIFIIASNHRSIFDEGKMTLVCDSCSIFNAPVPDDLDCFLQFRKFEEQSAAELQSFTSSLQQLEADYPDLAGLSSLPTTLQYMGLRLRFASNTVTTHLHQLIFPEGVLKDSVTTEEIECYLNNLDHHDLREFLKSSKM